MVNKLNKLQLDDFDALFEAASTLGVDAQALAEMIDLIDRNETKGIAQGRIAAQKEELESLFENYKSGKLDDEYKARLEYAISLVPRIEQVMNHESSANVAAAQEATHKKVSTLMAALSFGK